MRPGQVSFEPLKKRPLVLSSAVFTFFFVILIRKRSREVALA